MKKISEFLSKNFQFFIGEIFNILNRHVFVMDRLYHEIKPRTSRLVPACVTAILDFVEDPVKGTWTCR